MKPSSESPFLSTFFAFFGLAAIIFFIDFILGIALLLIGNGEPISDYAFTIVDYLVFLLSFLILFYGFSYSDLLRQKTPFNRFYFATFMLLLFYIS